MLTDYWALTRLDLKATECVEAAYLRRRRLLTLVYVGRFLFTRTVIGVRVRRAPGENRQSGKNKELPTLRTKRKCVVPNDEIKFSEGKSWRLSPLVTVYFLFVCWEMVAYCWCCCCRCFGGGSGYGGGGLKTSFNDRMNERESRLSNGCSAWNNADEVHSRPTDETVTPVGPLARPEWFATLLLFHQWPFDDFQNCSNR